MENNLRFLREEKELTQKAVCAELRKRGCYIDRTTYAKYELGSRNISCEMLVVLADVFDTTIDFILCRIK